MVNSAEIRFLFESGVNTENPTSYSTHESTIFAILSLSGFSAKDWEKELKRLKKIKRKTTSNPYNNRNTSWDFLTTEFTTGAGRICPIVIDEISTDRDGNSTFSGHIDSVVIGKNKRLYYDPRTKCTGYYDPKTATGKVRFPLTYIVALNPNTDPKIADTYIKQDLLKNYA